MLKKLQKLPVDMALIAHSGVQFVDYGFRIEKEFSRRFLERREDRADGQSWILRRLVLDPGSEQYLDAATGTAATEASAYSIQVKNAINAYNNIWLPVPFLKVKGAGSGNTFEEGPSNWARIRITALEKPDIDGNMYRLTLAFDTRTDMLAIGDAYTCPRPEDVRNETRFKLASDLSDSWFLDERWVRNWLTASLARAAALGQAKRILREDGEEAACAPWAYYCVVIDAIVAYVNGSTSNAALPTVRFLDTIKDANRPSAYRPINVDLVLDIGNSRTCGVLIESEDEPGVNLAKSSRLELRDLSRPQYAYAEPFRSHVEFALAEFGLSYQSRESGREGAFSWPSLVRVGPEALRMNGASSGADGDTGLSGPKRYLWDDREHRQLWYFNTAEEWTHDPTAVYGLLPPLLTQDGRVLADAGDDAQPAHQPRFSKASLFCFMVMELLLQAISQINAPGQRAGTTTPNVPRRLSRIVLTIPTGTPLLERARFQQQCDNAVKLLWAVLNWGPNGIADHPMPKIDIAYDEATCTQLVWMYSEIREKFLSKPGEFLRLMGSESGDSRSLRVASLDIGGGTTDLMITTYTVRGFDDALRPVQNFREGFRKAGDDILEAVISVHVLDAIAKALTKNGITDTKQFMTAFMNDGGKSAADRHKRKLFVSRVLVPIALAMLTQYEANGLFGAGRPPLTIAEIFPSVDESVRSPMDYFEEAAHDAGARDFAMDQVIVELDFPAIGKTVEGVIAPILVPLCAAIHEFQVDVLLVSGRPSRLPVMRDLLLRFMPVQPNRIVFMYEYEVGNWYPFSSGTGSIGDPKTTVVVGALLCTLANARRIPDFSLAGTSLNVESTANYIGRLFRDGQVRTEDVIFSHDRKEMTVDSEPIVFNQPLSIGFRQLPMEGWPATPLFFLDFADAPPQGADRTMPWKVRFVRDSFDRTERPTKAAKAVEDLHIASIIDRDEIERGPKPLALRLQTLKDGAGYWLDTGIVLPI